MLQANTFKTDSGYCHILLDKIIFNNTESPDEDVAHKEANGISKSVIVYSIVFSILIAGVISGILFSADLYYILIILVFALWFLFRIIYKIQHAHINIILRSSITKIEFKEAIYNLQNAHFVIHFKNSNNASRKKYIGLPTSLDNLENKQLQQQAINIMEEEFG